ncbi:MAG: hypothetical protein IPG04_16895 [Polyangiaceae bacterium]|nr:hypothetical protein [Polyangiaceae bacterium]
MFEEQFVSATLQRGADFVIGRLLTLPLTKNRASRILELALDHHELWEIDRLEEIAALAGPVDRVVPLPPSGEWMNTYKVLVGPSAGDTFQRAIDRAIEREHLDEAARIARLAPDLVSPDQRSALQSLARSLSVSALAAVQAEHPWLLSPSDVVAEATTPDRSWGIPGRLPGYLMPVMEAKAAATEDAGLATKLLDRLEELGAPRRKILGVALERLARDPTAVPAGWFSHRLDSKALWEDVGTETLTALLREPTTDRATVVYEVCHGALRSGADLCATMHTVLGRVLVRFAKEALTHGDTGKARTALTALAHLSPAPQIRQTVLALRKVGPHLDDEVEHLIELNAGLLRRGADLATLSDIAHALAALCGGQGGDP